MTPQPRHMREHQATHRPEIHSAQTRLLNAKNPQASAMRPSRAVIVSQESRAS